MRFAAVAGVLVLAAIAFWRFGGSAPGESSQFWQAEGAALIRNASSVMLITVERQPDSPDQPPKSDVPDVFKASGHVFKITKRTDVSTVPRLAELRSALLEDQSFVSSRSLRDQNWSIGLEFRDTPQSAPMTALFSKSFTCVMRRWPGHGNDRLDQCDALANELRTVFEALAHRVPEAESAPPQKVKR
jgi:hypothetical protein